MPVTWSSMTTHLASTRGDALCAAGAPAGTFVGMRRRVIHQTLATVPGKVVSSWLPEERVVIDTWESFFISLPDFRTAIFETALPAAVALGADAWIVDTHDARGVFSDDVQHFIATKGHALFAERGIRYFITVRPRRTAPGLSLQHVEDTVGPAGMQLVTVDSVDAALAFVRKERAARAA